MVGTILYQLTRCLSEEEIRKSGFDTYFVDHTTGVYPQAASGVPTDMKYIGVKGDVFADLHEDLAAEELGTVYIFHGEESYLREYYLTQMRKQLVPEGFEEFNYHRLEGKSVTMQLLQEICEAMPMMAQRTMVQIVDLDLFKMNEEQRNGFIALLDDFPEYCCLVLVYDRVEYKPNKTYKKLCAALDKAAQVVQFEEQSQSEILKWIARRFKATGHTIDVPTAEHLIFTCGSLMNGLIPEISKIASYAKSERITKADIDAVAAPVLEAQVFEMTGAVSKGDFNKAAELLGSLLKLQEEPFMILALIGKELRKLHTARIALDTGRDKFWLMERWNMRSDYPAKLLTENAKRVSRAWCARAVKRCYETDLRIKSVGGVDGADELKFLLMELAQGVRR